MATHPVSVGDAQGKNVFVPKTQPIAVGDEVKWTWADDSHSVTSDTGEWPDSGVHDTGHVFQHTFNTAGKYAYHCSIHGASGDIGMSGVIEVKQPVIEMAPGEVERWRFIHAGIAERLDMALQTADQTKTVKLHAIAADGIVLGTIQPMDFVSLSPGYRWDVLVQAPTTPGE